MRPCSAPASPSRNDIAVGDEVTLELAAGPESLRHRRTVGRLRPDDLRRPRRAGRRSRRTRTGQHRGRSDRRAPGVAFDTAVAHHDRGATSRPTTRPAAQRSCSIFGAIGDHRRRCRGARRDVVDDRQPVPAAPRARGAPGHRRPTPSPPWPGPARAAARSRRSASLGGLALGALGTRGIIASFESQQRDRHRRGRCDRFDPVHRRSARDRARRTARFVIVRSATRRPVTVTLRGAA